MEQLKYSSVVEWINNSNYIIEYWAAMEMDEKPCATNECISKSVMLSKRGGRMYTAWLHLYNVHTQEKIAHIVLLVHTLGVKLSEK